MLGAAARRWILSIQTFRLAETRNRATPNPPRPPPGRRYRRATGAHRRRRGALARFPRQRRGRGRGRDRQRGSLAMDSRQGRRRRFLKRDSSNVFRISISLEIMTAFLLFRIEAHFDRAEMDNIIGIETLLTLGAMSTDARGRAPAIGHFLL